MWLIAFVPLIYIAFALQLTLAPQLAIAGCMPQFVPLLLLLIVFRMSGIAGLLCAAGCGLIADCLAATGMGVAVVSFTWIAFIAQRASSRLSPRTPVVAGSIVAVLVAVAEMASAVARLWLAREQIAPGEIVWLSFGNGIYTGAVAVAVLFPLTLLPVSHVQSSVTHSAGRVANRWKMLTN